MSRNDICGECHRCDIERHPVEASGGMGLCVGFADSESAKINQFVPWDGRLCVLFGRIKDHSERQKRERWIREQKGRQCTTA